MCVCACVLSAYILLYTEGYSICLHLVKRRVIGVFVLIKKALVCTCTYVCIYVYLLKRCVSIYVHALTHGSGMVLQGAFLCCSQQLALLVNKKH